MATLQKQKWCGTCRRWTLHSRQTFGDGAGCFLSLITLGLFIPIWILIGISEAFLQPWRCQFCGRSRRV